ATRFTLGGGPLLLTVGAAYDRQDQARKGFVNNNGALGALRRDEDDTVHDQDVYAQAEWSPLPSLSLLAGARYSDVRFGSDDHYITDRKSTRLNSSHLVISYAVFCLKKKKKKNKNFYNTINIIQTTHQNN